MSKIIGSLKVCIAMGLVVLMASSCSVVMAARKSGTSIEKLQYCKTRGQFLAYGPVVISSEQLPTGEIIEVYQYQKERGSAARALMHGVLDVSTFGLWEVVGTPIEVCVDQQTFFTLKVYYDACGVMQRVELL